MSTGTVSFEQDNYIVKRLGSGILAAVYASIPRHIADPILAGYHQGPQTVDRFETTCHQLRAACEALKVLNPFDASICGQEHFSGEIAIVKQLKEHNQRNIPLFKECVQDREPAFYTQELLDNRGLGHFVKHYHANLKTHLPQAFVWHVIGQIAKALLLVQFGHTNKTQVSDWHFLAHNDLHSGNVLFRTPAKDGFKDYPDAVLIDFGNAKQLETTSSDKTKQAFYTRQQKDILNLLLELGPLVKQASPPNEELNRLFDNAQKVDVSLLDNKGLKHFLVHLVDKSEKRRTKYYQPLDPALVEYFSRPVVTVEEIAEIFLLTRPS